MTIAYRCLSRRDVHLEARDLLGLDALDRLVLKDLQACIMMTANAKKLLSRSIDSIKAMKLQKVGRILRFLLKMYFDYLSVELPLKSPIIRAVRASISGIAISGSNFSERFRFRSAEQLQRLLDGFQFPKSKIRIRSYVFMAEEVLLISLTRLSWPYRWCDIADKFPGRKRSALCSAFYWFLDFLIYNWAYLLLNNMNFWLPYFPSCAQAIRNKLATLPNVTYRQNFENADQPGGFAVSFFIDNTMVAMCRPGTIIAYPLALNNLILLLRRRPNYRR